LGDHTPGSLKLNGISTSAQMFVSLPLINVAADAPTYRNKKGSTDTDIEYQAEMMHRNFKNLHFI